jgi:hypothetical protein
MGGKKRPAKPTLTIHRLGRLIRVICLQRGKIAKTNDTNGDAGENPR